MCNSWRVPYGLRPSGICVDDSSKRPTLSGFGCVELVDAFVLGEDQVLGAVLVRSERRDEFPWAYK